MIKTKTIFGKIFIMKLFSVFFFFVASFSIHAQNLNASFEGASQLEQFGLKSAISPDGKLMAVSTASDKRGVVFLKIYKRDENNSWVLKQTISSTKSGFGHSISFSKDGSTMAIGSHLQDSLKGSVDVYSYNDGTDLFDLSATINGSANYWLGYSVSLSSDGKILAIGAPSANTEGLVLVYQNKSGTWERLGRDIEVPDESIDDFLGSAVSLSSDGLSVAIAGEKYRSDKGRVMVYTYNISLSDWTLKGNILDGENEGDVFGSSIVLSEDSNTLAVSAVKFNGSQGAVYVYDYKNTDWELRGSKITKGGGNISFGSSLSMVNNGNVIAVGASDDINSRNAPVGSVSMYGFLNSSYQLLSSILGENKFNFFGRSVCLSANANIITVGADGYGAGDKRNRGKQYIYDYNIAPASIELTKNTIQENQSIGSITGALSTQDLNALDTHSYTLTDTTNYPDNSSFAISGTNLVTSTSFDFETKNTYTILVETSDGTDTYTKTFTISITDVDEDSDGDSIPNSLDNCSNVANASQADADSDGIGDACDNAPNTPNPDQKDTDGDGEGDLIDPDDDNDGCLDTSDAFPLDATECSDTDGDGSGDNTDPDNDNDGVLDTLDNCVNTPNADQLDTDADGIGNVCDSDDDNDGFSDVDETTCGTDPLNATSTPTDTDADDTPDCIDTDDDDDGFSDEIETTCGTNPLDATSTPTDTDADGTPDCIDTDDDNDGYEDNTDVFPLDATEWIDTDADGTGNNVDTDDDNDGQTDVHEVACGSDPLDANETSADADADGLPNCVDEDDDNDGVNDSSDAFPLDPSEWTDTDGDGIGNNADEDDDNDGYSDFDELACASDPLDQFKKPTDMDGDFTPDCLDEDKDGDGYLNDNDAFPLDATEWSDTDGDGLGDNFEVDDDNDGVLDSEDAFPQDPTESKDSDGDGIGDNADPDDNNDGFEDNKLFVSGVITPNSNTFEQKWMLVNIEKYPNARVRVYNKNGQEVFSKVNYTNDWRGTFKSSNNSLPAGPYYYIIDLANGEDPIKGWLYLTY